MKKLIILLLGVIAFITLGHFCTQQKQSLLDSNNAISINSLMMKANPELVDVKFIPQGDKAIIVGQVDSKANQLLAQRIVEAEGYFSVNNQIDLIPAKKRIIYQDKHQIEIELSSTGKLHLSGVLNNEQIATELIELAFDKYGIKNVNTDLFEDPSSNPLIGQISTHFLNSLPIIDYAKATISAKKLVVDGSSYSLLKLQQFKKNIIEHLPKHIKTDFNLKYVASTRDTDHE